VGTLAVPNRDGSLLLGGSIQAAVAPEPEDPSVPTDIVRRASALLPDVAGLKVLGSWWGIRPMTPDVRPIVGRAAPGLTVATGHGSQGVILGGGTGELVASVVLGQEPPFDPSPFDPRRFG
jgi:glycine/D-amino acid oxidase-like deaminating enzyme